MLACKKNYKTLTALVRIIFFIIASPCLGNDSKLDLSPEEKAWLNKHHIVRGRIGNAPPFMLTDGEIRGISIDYLTHIFTINGIKFRYINESEVSWPQALEYIKQHEVVDMVPTAKITEDRKKDMVFTWIIVIAGVAVLFIGFVLIWNRRLKSEVAFRKNIEMELRESEQHISSIFRSAPVGIGQVVNRVLKSVNSRLCEITGYEEQEILGQSARMLYPTDDDFEFVGREKYNQITAHGTGTVETRWQRKDGAIIDVLLSSTPVDLKDWSRGVTFTALDITERKQAEKNLDMAHDKLLTILDSIDATIYVADMETCEILFMNKKMITDLGGEKITEKCYQTFRQKTEPCDFCTNNQLVDADGRLVRLQIATDITEIKKMERQLIQAQKMESVGRLAGGVAHDFNNMLGVILGHTELALEKTDEHYDFYADLKEIQTAARRSADLTKQLLTFARKQIIDPRRIDLNHTIENMLNMLRRLIGEDIHLAWQPANGLWPVKMDPSQVDQILANLCVNARDAIEDVGKLTIETGMVNFDEAYCTEHGGFIPGDFVLLAVSDNGCGMDKQILENLFEPFFTTKNVGKGTGLGLATVYGIVKQNKGFINVYSEPGQGTTFKIYLPRYLGPDETPAVVDSEKQDPTGNETILLVEDEPAILRMTRTILERKGYSVLTSATPAEAIAMACAYSGKIHLLMTDVVMPEMNGRDLAGHLTALYPDIGLLFMSGYTANVIAHHGVLDEGVAFIQKPFSMKDLTKKVRGVLDRSSKNEDIF